MGGQSKMTHAKMAQHQQTLHRVEIKGKTGEGSVNNIFNQGEPVIIEGLESPDPKKKGMGKFQEEESDVSGISMGLTMMRQVSDITEQGVRP